MSTRKDEMDTMADQRVDRRRLMLMGGMLASGCFLADATELFAQGTQGGNDGAASRILVLNLGKIHEQIEIPASLPAAQLKRDCEKMLSILQKSPNEVQDIVAKIHSGDQQGARKVVEKIGLTEEVFSQQGGGLWHLLILLAAAYLLHKLG